ncbi:hypothetical protein [Spirosoma endbachense]|uniref:Uncharacterized protein n=1 Tax=Spirosoma endbachense TaxID=2666025 RepID=A0A6P1W392_9BACT|nr:hypothetical protein [Spirosoma endbachense]QHV99018.1 hypothetical protein GJR95_30205 [Spirosoma endbachense]
MTTQLARKISFRILTLSITIAALLSACSKPGSVDPPVAIPAQYELKDVRYFFNIGDGVDTTTLHLKGLRVQNPGSTLSTQQVEDGFSELVKTSQFVIDQTNFLPKETELSRFELRVPQHWYGNGSFDFSVETYPLSVTQQQKPYGFEQKELVTIRIPPKSNVDISRQIDAYHLECSFQAVLENRTTGQRYPLTGKWKGLLQYANPTTMLMESSL